MTGLTPREIPDLRERPEVRLMICALLLILGVAVHGGPMLAPGDLALRHDIRLLADHGMIKGPVSGWPLAWGPIMDDLARIEREADLPNAVQEALYRVRERSRLETRLDEIRFSARASIAEKPNRIRSYQNTPREDAELSLGVSWTGEYVSADVNGQAVASPQDGKTFRYDNSVVGILLGNFAVTASTMDRWWGPGWDSSLILSSNARPIPALTIERNFTDAFKTKWLSWLGPWDISVLFGRMEADRHIPHARFFGMRFDFRPIPSLEIGVSRAAQWCGEGRPCGFDTFVDLLAGRDNRGDAGIGVSNEPGNQLAGVDFRWSLAGFELPFAFYGQFIGEDEAGGFPSRYLGMLGIDASRMFGSRWSSRGFAEAAYTKCNFYNSAELFNCAYNHSIYRSGYRYRGRAIGHGGDNDTLMLSAGILLVDRDESQWQGIIRYGELNRGGAPDDRNTLTTTRRTLYSFDLVHSRVFPIGVIEVGAGFEHFDGEVSGNSNASGRAYLHWRNSY